MRINYVLRLLKNEIYTMYLEKIAPLFRGWDKAMIWSCLQGCMGYAVSDDLDNPASAMICVGDLLFLRRPAEFSTLSTHFKLQTPNSKRQGLGTSHRNPLRQACKKNITICP